MVKRLKVLMMFCAVAATVLAVPAKRVVRKVSFADGVKTLTLVGDETMHYYMSEDGTAYREEEEGKFVSMDLSSAKAQWKARSKARNTKRKATWGADRQDIRGKKKGLVILVNFSDLSMKHSQSIYNDYFNKEGYNSYGMGGSVRDYFLSQSYGLLDIDFDVVGPVTVSKTMSYYGQNDSDGNDKYPATMVIEALNLVDSQVNFADYDWDGDGEVDQVYVIYAGYGEAQGASTNTIWPHEWQLSEAKTYGDGTGALTKDGVKIDTYACSCELTGTSGSTIDGVGTACHEFSHCLGIPDMYDTEGSNFGMGDWDLMDYGCYGGDGYVPCGYTSYERMYSGWLNPVVLDSYTQVKDMPALTEDSVAYIIYNQANKNEYYLLENRQKKGWDAELPGHGMMVLHVDFDSNSWINDVVNNTANHQRMTIIPADGALSETSASLAGDPWPGTSKKTELTDETSPAATLYNANSDGKKYMHFPIRNISENTTKGTISFTAGEVSIDAPVALEATNISATGFTANWNEVDQATGYQVVLTAYDKDSESAEPQTLLAEDFSGFNNNASQDGSVDLSSKLDAYTQTSGWTGSCVYQTPNNEAKLGASKKNGTLTTPKLSAPQGGKLTVTVGCRKYGSKDDGKLLVLLNDEQINAITPQDEETSTSFTVDCDDDFTLTLQTSEKRAYVTALELSEMGAKTEKTTVNTTDTHYVFTDLDSSKKYKYVVYALIDESSSKASNAIEVSLTEGADALETVKVADKSSAIYDLSGRRVQSVHRGIYIKNGKKILK